MEIIDLPQHVQALDAALQGDYSRARSLLAELPAEIPARLVRADPEIFSRRYEPSPDGSSWMNEPSFLVVSPAPDGAAPAVHRAAERIMMLTESSRECADWECADEWTPNSSRVRTAAAAGLVILVNTKSEVSMVWADAMLRILVDELIAAQVPALVMAPPGNVDFTMPTWEPPTAPEAMPPQPKAIFIARDVRVAIGDGRTYWDRQFLDPAGSWTFDKAAAQTWSDSPRELTNMLCQEPRSEEVMLPRAVYLNK